MHTLRKTPWERVRIRVDFANELSADESISSFTVACEDTSDGIDSTTAIIHNSAMVVGFASEVFLLVKGGAVGAKHKITVQVATSFYNSFEEEVMVVVDTTFCGSFTKQPNDIFSVLVDFANDCEPLLEHIESVSIVVTDRDTGEPASLISGRVIDGTTVCFGILGGDDGHEYDISLQALGSFSTWVPQQQLEQIVTMKVRAT